MEDLVEDERKNLGSKIESLESLVRMLELKAKNASDHGRACVGEIMLSGCFPLQCFDWKRRKAK